MKYLIFLLFFISCEKENCDCGAVLSETATQIQTTNGFEQVMSVYIQNECSGNVKNFQMSEAEWFGSVQRNNAQPYYINSHSQSVYCNTTSW